MSPRGRRGGGPRSEDDRQRARLEREQRRAEREGRPVPRSIDDVPVGEPSIDPTGLVPPRAEPDAPRSGAGRTAPADQDPTDTLWSDGGDAATPPDPAAGPVGRRQRLQDLRAATEPAADREQRRAEHDDRDAGAAGAATSRPATSRPGGADDPTRPAGAQPWWSTAGGDGGAPPPPTAPPTADDRQVRPDPRDPDAIRAPGVLGAAPGVPRGSGRGADGGARPAAREAEDWFGAEGTEDTGDHLPGPGGPSNPGAARPTSGGRRTSADHVTPGARPTPTDRRAASSAAAEPLVPLRPAGPAKTSGTAPATVHTRTAPSRRGVSRIAAFLVLVPFVVLIAAVVFLFQPFKGDGEGEVRVRIPPGSSVDDIGTLLKDRGVVSNSLAFAIRARISGDGGNLKAGTLRLKRGMSYGAALTALQQDPLPPSVVQVSIPEGLSRTETASVIKKAGVTGSYLTASSRASGFDPTDFGQPRARRGLEGFLFPATYELQRGGATSKDLVAAQLKSFRTNIAKVSMRRARRAKLSPYEVLIIASMIEREVRVPSERRLVAAVIWNRLDQDIALGIDATTRYAVKNWTRPLKQSEIDRDTPYDTRRRKGLPPTPIGSPGLSAIRAAANPADEKYLYYVVRPCSDGRHSFASSDAEFQKDVAAYNAAQKRAGGDPSPSDAKGC